MERWSSRIGFILAAIGAAVGVGNIWRFPAVVGQNGGGAYLVPYLIAVAVVAIPLVMLEVGIGRRVRGDVVRVFASVRPAFRFLGWFVAGVVFLILSYYLVIVGWTLAYAGLTATGRATDFAAFTATWIPLGAFLVITLVTGLVVAFGVKRGIERVALTLMPLTFLILIGMAVFAFTLDGHAEGLAFFLTPDFTVLGNAGLWAAAFGQAFFSVGVGWGIMITFGAYLERATSIPRSAVIIVAADLLVALLAGLVIFPVVMTFALEPTLGAELAFTTLPRAFELMPLGAFWGTLFFALLLFAGLSSAIAIMEVDVAAVTGSTSLTRRQASLLVTGALLLFGLPSALAYSPAAWTLGGAPILDLLDETVGDIGLPLAGLLGAIAFTWFMQRAWFDEEMAAKGPVVRAVFPVVKYVIPPVLILITVMSLGGVLAEWGPVPIVVAGVIGLVLIGVAVARALRNGRGARPSG